MKNIFVTISVCLFAAASFAQKKVAVLGSSTAEGTGASPIDSSWVARLQASFRKNTSDGVDTIIDNRAKGGYTTYHSLPTGSSVPAGRPVPDPDRNVTYVLNSVPKPDVVIINYPTNDIAWGFTAKEMMDNLRLMFDLLDANGVKCYITTSQPRNTVSDAQRTILRQLVDSIRINFGLYSINFWDDIATNDGLNMIKPEVNADGTHVNNLGHRLLFQQVQSKNVFGVAGAPLPLVLKDWYAQPENNTVRLKWITAQEDPNTVFEIQRSGDGRSFETLFRKNGVNGNAEYAWTDLQPLTGKSFYRLKIIEPTVTSYSRIVSISNQMQQLMSSVHTDGSMLHINLSGLRSQTAEISVINYSGMVLKKQSFMVSASSKLSISIAGLAPGHYFLRISTSGAPDLVERFSKMK